MKLEINRVTKTASLATIIGMTMAFELFPSLMILVPLGVLTVLIISYPGAEKVGIIGMARHIQSMYAVTLIAFIAIIIATFVR